MHRITLTLDGSASHMSVAYDAELSPDQVFRKDGSVDMVAVCTALIGTAESANRVGVIAVFDKGDAMEYCVATVPPVPQGESDTETGMPVQEVVDAMLDAMLAVGKDMGVKRST
jgi:hypothetical protein